MSTARTRLAVLAVVGAVTAAGAGVIAAPADAHAVSRCGNSSLAVTRTFGQGGAGHGWLSLVYRNTTRHTCSVSGYPGVDAVTRTGHVLAHAKRTRVGYAGGGRLRTVSIKPGAYASATVEWLNFNGRTGGSCRFSAAVVNTVANTTRDHRLAASVSACGLQVHPTVAGTPGYPHYGQAQHAWIEGSHVDSAGLNRYLRIAEHQLRLGRDYPMQVAELAQLIAFPETGLTPSQVKQARADVKDLDRFFATPGLY